MTTKKQTLPILSNALLWGAIILATAMMTKGALDEGKSFLLLILQVSAWFTMHGIISREKNPLREEWACLKQKLGGGK